jgi:hypothetical protein
MNALERTRAVFRRERPDMVPFMPYENLILRGDYERELRHRGMGLCTMCTAVSWSEWPNVRFGTKAEGPVSVSTWETPVGSVSSWQRAHLDRRTASSVLYGNAGVERNVLREGWIKGLQDYDPVIFVIDDEVIHEDYINYEYTVRDFREDCLVRVAGLFSPYDTSYAYFGDRTPKGFANWVYAQSDHPKHFGRLLESLERREERRYQAIKDTPGEVLRMHSLGGWFGPWYGPKQFRKHALPFFNRYVPLLHKDGRLLSLKADTTNLKAFKDLIPQAGVDIVEGFLPPPIGDLSIAEARKAWGDRMIIWVSFPESVFWEGVEATRRYTLDLLREDPSGMLILGMTTMGTSMIADEQTACVFRAGMGAIMDAIETVGH